MRRYRSDVSPRPALPRRAFVGSHILACALVLLLAAAPAFSFAPTYDSAFWRAWGDGRAELAGYSLVRPRYGELRTGSAVLIFVTEPWSVSKHVKVDDESKHPKSDVIQVLKLNIVEDFPTGIYDYNLMTSAWTALMAAPGRPAGSAAKVSFSAQEWCGTTWHDVTFDARSGAEVVRSYFEGETTMRMLDNPAADRKPSLVEDNVLVWARGLAAPLVARGAHVDVAFLPALSRSRLEHRPLAWTRATLSRDAAPVRVTVPAGTFEVERATVAIEDAPARTIEIFVEVAPPHRIVKVTHSDGTVMELRGSVREPYWKQNRQTDTPLRAKLGL